jgi:hypothetical protein
MGAGSAPTHSTITQRIDPASEVVPVYSRKLKSSIMLEGRKKLARRQRERSETIKRDCEKKEKKNSVSTVSHSKLLLREVEQVLESIAKDRSGNFDHKTASTPRVSSLSVEKSYL